MRSAGVIFVLFVQFALFGGLSGDGSFDPEQHPNFKLLPPKDKCGVSAVQERTGGAESNAELASWRVKIGMTTFAATQFMRGGNLISDYYVLTATSCILYEGRKLPVESVLLGDMVEMPDADCDGDQCFPYQYVIKIVEIIFHEDFVDGVPANDIALLRLESPALANSFIQPVCLPYGAGMTKDFTGEDVLSVGWLSFGEDYRGATAQFIQEIKLDVQDASKCKADYAVENFTDEHICARIEGFNASACMGDCGGPLTWTGSFEADISARAYLIGVTTFGSESCGEEGREPMVFERTTFFMKWILDHMK